MTDKMQNLPHPDGTIIAYPEENLHTIPTDILRAELARLITITADHLTYLATVWRELERRGEDLSDLRSGLAVYLPLIASRHLDAEAVVSFAGNRSLLGAIAQLPLDEQRRLAHGGKVPFVTVDSAGVVIEKEIPASRLRPSQTKQVFDGGRIRPPFEQVSLVGLAPARRAIILHLSADEHRALKIRAAEAGRPIPEVIRAAITAAGLI